MTPSTPSVPTEPSRVRQRSVCRDEGRESRGAAGDGYLRLGHGGNRGEGPQVRNEMAAGDRDVGMVEYEFLTADGERFPAEMRFNRVTGEEGEELNRVGVIRDETSERAAARGGAPPQERTARGVREHRLARPPEPLNVAQGRLDLAREEYDSEHLEVVANAHERMAALIDDLLTLARDARASRRRRFPSANSRRCAGRASRPQRPRSGSRPTARSARTGADSDSSSRTSCGTAWNTVVRETAIPSRDDENSETEFSNHSTSSRAEPGDAVVHAGEDVTVTVGDVEGASTSPTTAGDPRERPRDGVRDGVHHERRRDRVRPRNRRGRRDGSRLGRARHRRRGRRRRFEFTGVDVLD